jgi:hypothetical protein
MRVAASRVIWTIAAACLMATAQPPSAQAGETSRISGVVVNRVTGQPLSQARVLVAPDDGSSKEIETITGTDGRFVFDRVPAGSWTLQAERRGFLGQKYGQRSLYTTGAISIVTGPGGVSENLTFGLNPPAAIRGKVVDENGEPVMGAFLQFLVQIPSARTEFLVRKTVATDDAGEYRIPDLPAGTCYLFAVVPVPESGTGFAPQYYPNATDARAATPIQLKAGEEFTGDFTLQRGRGVSVEIEGVSGIPGGSESELLILLTQGPQGSEVSAGTLGPGSGRTFHNVLPGRYKFVIGDLRGAYATSKWIEVGSEDLTVTLPFHDPPEVTAKVRVVNGDSKSLQQAMLGLVAFAGAGNNSRPLGPDGTAVFPGMAAGRYDIVLHSPGLYIKSVSARNARVADGLVDLPESGPVQLEIVAAGDGARVKGKVQSGGKPMSGVQVVLAPSQQSANPDDYHGYESDSDGTFDFRAVRPGDYTIFAIDDGHLEYGNGAAIGKYLAAGKAVKAEPKGSVELQLEILRR